MANEKIRTSFWTNRELLNECDLRLKIADCRNRSEFINKAVEHYCGYLAIENNFDYVSNQVSELLTAIIGLTEKRIARMQFKEAVELAKITKMIAPLCGLDELELQRLHIACVNEVKKVNGIITYEKSVAEHREQD